MKKDRLGLIKLRQISWIALFIICYPSLALAHGEEIIALPVGQFLALILVLVLVVILRMKTCWKAGAIVAAFLSGFACWFLPNLNFIFMKLFGDCGWPLLFIGLLFPVVAALAVFFAPWWFSRLFGRKK